MIDLVGQMRAHDDRFDRWLASLETRHLAELTFPEVARALRALSSAYVERRQTLVSGAALAGAGKRAAFALFYGPIHYLLVREIVAALPGADGPTTLLVDLGCGTGAAGAAWALACTPPPTVLGVDRHSWALSEAARTYRDLGLTSRVRRSAIETFKIPGGPSSALAAFALNELTPDARDAFLTRAISRVKRGRLHERPGQRHSLLIVEPLAGFVAPWWSGWREVIVAAGGRADEWRFRVELPSLVAKLDRAAGLNHRELTARSLWLG